MNTHLRLTRSHVEEMIRHVDSLSPLEACGLLAGRAGQVEAVIPITNAEHSPVKFRMDPLEQLRAFEWMDERGLHLLGIFHSHPSGPETASPTDLDEAAYDVVQIILSQRESAWQTRGFFYQNGKAEEAILRIE